MIKTVQIPNRLADQIQAMADREDVSLDAFVTYRLSRDLDAAWQARLAPTAAIAMDRSQRPEARSDRRLDWWRKARFGMFIHWGLYALLAGEWQGQRIPGIGEWIMKHAMIPVAEYEKLASQFNPVHFDADAWVRLAKEAGQKYLVITAKHHDGFCLFRTAHTDYNIVDATPFGRDPMAELAEACERHGVRLCFYYSQTQDWHNPDGDGNFWDYDEQAKDFDGYVNHYVKPQVVELLTQYGDIGVIWFDTPRRMTGAQSRSLLRLVREIQPDCLVCGRIGNTVGDYASAGDNAIPEVAVDLDWETPATINDTWGYKTHDHNWKSSTELIHKLIDIASKGGNYLLNVGPTAEGLIPQPSVERLQAMGAWLQANGEAIYSTVPGPVQGVSGLRSTARSGRTYLHVLDWPSDGSLHVAGARGPVSEARFLSPPDAQQLPIRVQKKTLMIDVPQEAPDATTTVVALDVD